MAQTPTSSSQIDALLQRRHRDARGDAADDSGVTTLLCASGRGGSGTTLLAALLAVAAAGEGARVLLVDADEHVGPLAMLLGVSARASWQDLRGGRVSPTDVATPVSTTLTLVAGGAARHATSSAAPMSAAERRACMRRVGMLSHGMDLVVIDCGARFDTISAALAPHAGERLLAVAAGADPIGLAATYALCKAVHARHSALPLDVLVNRHEGVEALRCFEAIDAGVRQFLGSTLRFAGAVPTDPTLDAALRAGMPFPDAAAGSPAAIAAHDVVMRTLAGTSPTRPGV
ncbi:MAG: cellulose synthase operon protein YhjQ/BcsQ [Gemmatimonas sp.]